ncbi:hypothetical protein EJ08DRAFT_658968 [Tothia fuscella]|uniref:Uncharacterized protein n=1 Tax=Tothia fuscella TaxID=1048955 RepID=A0A9P4NWX3_9PEZI|nr:hypothetical protein EJ08DRAFT_658968 [Tothia fuscella]
MEQSTPVHETYDFEVPTTPLQASLLSLPSELRDLIYDQIVGVWPLEVLAAITNTGQHPPNELQFLLTNRQIYQEARVLAFRKLYLGETEQGCHLHFHAFEECKLKQRVTSLSELNRNFITEVTFTILIRVMSICRYSVFPGTSCCLKVLQLLPFLKKMKLYRTGHNSWGRWMVYRTCLQAIDMLKSLQQIEYWDDDSSTLELKVKDGYIADAHSYFALGYLADLRLEVTAGSYTGVRQHFALWLQRKLPDSYCYGAWDRLCSSDLAKLSEESVAR